MKLNCVWKLSSFTLLFLTKLWLKWAEPFLKVGEIFWCEMKVQDILHLLLCVTFAKWSAHFRISCLKWSIFSGLNCSCSTKRQFHGLCYDANEHPFNALSYDVWHLHPRALSLSAAKACLLVPHWGVFRKCQISLSMHMLPCSWLVMGNNSPKYMIWDKNWNRHGAIWSILSEAYS